MPPDIIETLRQHKHAVIALLRVQQHYVEAYTAIDQLQRQAEYVRSLLLAETEAARFPRLQLDRWLMIEGGRERWEQFLLSEAIDTAMLRRLADALVKFWAFGTEFAKPPDRAGDWPPPATGRRAVGTQNASGDATGTQPKIFVSTP